MLFIAQINSSRAENILGTPSGMPRDSNHPTYGPCKVHRPPPCGPKALFDRPSRPNGLKTPPRPGFLRSIALLSWMDEDAALERRSQLLKAVRAVASEASSGGSSLRRAT